MFMFTSQHDIMTQELQSIIDSIIEHSIMIIRLHPLPKPKLYNSGQSGYKQLQSVTVTVILELKFHFH